MNNIERYGQNICWDCQKAVCGCNWSRKFEPVEGWEAEEVPYSYYQGKIVTFSKTYHITKCPEFVRDEPRKTNGQILTPEENAEFMKGKRVKIYAGYKRTEDWHGIP